MICAYAVCRNSLHRFSRIYTFLSCIQALPETFHSVLLFNFSRNAKSVITIILPFCQRTALQGTLHRGHNDVEKYPKAGLSFILEVRQDLCKAGRS